MPASKIKKDLEFYETLSELLMSKRISVFGHGSGSSNKAPFRQLWE